jgi:hypothetical protein
MSAICGVGEPAHGHGPLADRVVLTGAEVVHQDPGLHRRGVLDPARQVRASFGKRPAPMVWRVARCVRFGPMGDTESGTPLMAWQPMQVRENTCRRLAGSPAASRASSNCSAGAPGSAAATTPAGSRRGSTSRPAGCRPWPACRPPSAPWRRGPTPTEAVTAAAAAAAESAGAASAARRRRLVLRPRLELLRRHRVEAELHVRVRRPAVLGAEAVPHRVGRSSFGVNQR